MKKIKLLGASLLALALSAGCAANPAQNPVGTAASGPTVTRSLSTASPIPTTAATPPATGEEHPSSFGRYAALYEGALFYADGGAVKLYSGGASRTLCTLPEGEAPESLFAANGNVLYLSTRAAADARAGEARRIYQIAVGSNNEYPMEIALSQGPMLASGSILYYIVDGKLTGLNTADKRAREYGELGPMARLSGLYGGGTALYYQVFKQADESGTLYGASTLYRFDLSGGASEWIADMGKLRANEYILERNGLLYRISAGNGGAYELSVLDSDLGGIQTAFKIPETVLGGRIGSEFLFRVGDTLCMLLGGTADARTTAYAFTVDKPEAAEIWRRTFDKNAADYQYDPVGERLAVLFEGGGQSLFELRTLDYRDGRQIKSVTVGDGTSGASLRLIAIGGMALIYSIAGEDDPVINLEYLCALSDMETPLSVE